MSRVRKNFFSGTLSSQLLSGATTILSSALSSFPEVVSPDVAYLVVDPDGSTPEIVKVTAHTSAATSATIVRGQDSTTDRTWAAGTTFIQAPIASDFDASSWNEVGLFADIPTASANNAGHTYFATDIAGGTSYRSNGSSWVQASAGVSAQPSSVWLPASAFVTASGSPTLGLFVQGAGGWLMSDTAIEYVQAWVYPPQWWATFDIDLWWSNDGGGAGDVVWRRRINTAVSDGDTVSAPSGTLYTVTAPGDNVVEVTSIGTGQTVTAGELVQLVVERVGNTANDTLANDAVLIGCMLRQAS